MVIVRTGQVWHGLIMEDGFKTVPYAHQLETLHRMRDREEFAVFWEMGCGKSKVVIDDAAYLVRTGKINGLLVLAPNGVHRNWITDEIPTHMPDDIDVESLAWYSGRSKSRAQIQAQNRVLYHKLATPALAVLSMTYEGFRTERGKEVAKDFLTRRRVMMVCDESTKIKTPGAKRTKLVLGAAKYARYRRILTGTPVANGPFDVYAQIRFLDQEFWKRHDIDTYLTFQHSFGVFIQQKIGGGRSIPQLVRYRDLERLGELLKSISSRVTKEEVLDLPPKVYTKRFFTPTEEQRYLYDRLKEEFITEHATGSVTAALAIVRLTRFCQILSNYVPLDGPEKELVEVGPRNPRLELLEEVVGEVLTQGIIWARFRHDIDMICEKLGDRCVRYDGSTSQADREINIKRFQAGEVQFFVANPAAIAMGVTLLGAKTVIYYNNSFNLTDRQQSEDRPHRIGQDQTVTYVDIVAEDSVDEHIVRSLVRKQNVASVITGDEIRQWL